MRKRVFYSMIVCLAVFFSVECAAAKTYYVKKNGTKLKQKEKPTSPLVANLEKGTSVEFIGKKKRYYHVKLNNGDKGWVYKFKLSDKPIKKSGLGALKIGRGLKAKEARSAGSIRSLDEDIKNVSVQKKPGAVLKGLVISFAEEQGLTAAAIDATKQLQQGILISEEMLEQFQQEGSIGSYAGDGS